MQNYCKKTHGFPHHSGTTTLDPAVHRVGRQHSETGNPSSRKRARGLLGNVTEGVLNTTGISQATVFQTRGSEGMHTPKKHLKVVRRPVRREPGRTRKGFKKKMEENIMEPAKKIWSRKRDLEWNFRNNCPQQKDPRGTEGGGSKGGEKTR